MVKIESEPKLDFSNVLIRPKRSTLNSRSEVDLTRTFNFKNGQTWNGVPIIAANMATTGTFEIYSVMSKHKMLTALHKFYTISDYQSYISKYGELNKEYFMVSTGISDENYLNLISIVDNIDCKFICIDIANGYISKFVQFCKKVRDKYPNKIIIAGNVVTREMVEELILNGGVDIVKVGIGPGSACTTRKKNRSWNAPIICYFRMC